ncbi:MAG TPA: MFS transporter, partial [Mycobacteriales bacterium]|nr:MFS transporter [Mycobacteriales bacterium]
VLAEKLVPNPLLPLRIPADRTRGGAYLSVLFAVLGMFSILFFLTFYLQQIKGFSPTRTGVAFLPMTGGVVFAAGMSSRLGAHVAPRYLLGTGLAILSGGMLILTRLSADSGYASVVLPALITVGIGLGMVMITSVNAATLGVRAQDAGVASATVNAAQQVGGSLGTALLSTIAANASSAYFSDHQPVGRAVAATIQRVHIDSAVHGYTVAAWYGCGILAAGAVIAFLLINGKRADH